jgi:SAM-dependent methyltransferase
MEPKTKDYLITLLQLLNGQRYFREVSIAKRRELDLSPYININSRLKILDLANGRLRPQYYLLQSKGYEVFGIDIVNASKSSHIDLAYRFARWLYTRHIPSKHSSLDYHNLICGDVSKLPLKDDIIDAVTSVAAFEHFLDVPSVVLELKRVLRPGGLVWARIHLFTSPSGGHKLGFTEIPLRKIPRGIDPWDHLRKKKLPAYTPLNQWRKHQYLQVFSDNFEILNHYCVVREGQHLLTPEIESELNEYSRDELTCRSYVIVARKS